MATSLLHIGDTMTLQVLVGARFALTVKTSTTITPLRTSYWPTFLQILTDDLMTLDLLVYKLEGLQFQFSLCTVVQVEGAESCFVRIRKGC